MTLKGDTDAQLVAKSLDGGGRAFRVLVERHQPLVYSVARGVLGTGEDVDDTVQDIFIKVFQGLSRFRGDSRFSTWIYRIARNEALNAVRKRRSGMDSIDDVELMAPAADRPDEQYRRGDQQRVLDGYMAQLDENHRVVLELRYMGEKSYNEISEIMDVPIGTIKTYIHRAKQELKRKMMTRTVDGDQKASRHHEV
ncbi:MAG: sigma-70 family RNA polymerase sigma factor [bacterium]|nr:sigma-70 family RNA polymerase sigma factor [bacterium]